jgi:CheY-like chemotaxis protein
MANALIMLLVADSVARVVIQETLEKGGYPVMAAGDLGTAVKRMSESRPDLLDIGPHWDPILKTFRVMTRQNFCARSITDCRC